MNDDAVGRVHWSFWLLGIVALIWNALGGMNYLMQMNPEVLAEYPEAARVLAETRPGWATGAFAIAVFGGALGGILLLLRKRVAVYLFIAALVGVIVTNIHTIRVPGLSEIWLGSAMSLVIAAFFVWYSITVQRKEWII